MEQAVTLTTRNFERSHGRKPSYSARGSFALQQSTTEVAFERDLVGEIRWFNNMLLSEAKKALKAEGSTGIWAVLP